MFRPKAYLVLILLLWNLAAASAQERVWNAALDWYENVCGRCADWMDKIERGEPVPKDSLQMMANELAVVKKNLQGAWGEMTPGQRLRFEVIRDRFATGRWHKDLHAPLSSLPVIHSPQSHAVQLVPSVFPWREDAVQVPWKQVRPRVRVGVMAGLTTGVYPDFSAGAVLGVTLDDWSLFAKGRGSGGWHDTSYDCLSDGSIQGGGYFWSGDEQAVGRLQLTFDVAYKVLKPLSVYVGAGYGIRSLSWKDWNGDWARVTDRCFSGFAADAGVLVHPVSRGPASGLALLVGCSWVNGGYVDAEAGLCWRF